MFHIPNTAGEPLTHDDVLFAWSLSEAFSPRWREAMARQMGTALRSKIQNGQTSDYSNEEGQELIRLLTARRPTLLKNYLDGSAHYKLIAVPGEMLEMLPVLPECAWKPYPILLGHYIDGPHDPNSPHDARAAAKRYAATPPPAGFTGYPIIAYSKTLSCDVLLDGYSRCIGQILKKRAGEKTGDMLMIYGAR